MVVGGVDCKIGSYFCILWCGCCGFKVLYFVRGRLGWSIIWFEFDWRRWGFLYFFKIILVLLFL